MVKCKHMSTDNTGLIKGRKNYSDLLAVNENVEALIRHCEQLFREYNEKADADEAKNERFRVDYQEFTFKRAYGASLKIKIYDTIQGFIDLDSLDSYRNAVATHIFSSPKYLSVMMDLSFRSGKGNDLVDHKRIYEARLEHGKSYFEYESNEEDASFSQVCQGIEEVLNQFPAVHTIFSTNES